eukprot:CAMPEP_0119537740 /NCGR_PEP_ID=MMETSP1344-20130328/50332_1 /TAXON_ID=236787 /ORGANISM="Florenciella parvula, Strain CCMP2471" /LENGTH=140 /DNA_ID=CAMNT_0007580351 /DNA_START=26 /DNA_END=444 /DNA_ORIENTATION=+
MPVSTAQRERRFRQYVKLLLLALMRRWLVGLCSGLTLVSPASTYVRLGSSSLSPQRGVHHLGRRQQRRIMAAINAASATKAPLLLNETAAKAGQSMVHHFGGTESVSRFGDYRVTVLVRQEEGGPCVLNDLKDGEAVPPP